MTFNQLLNAAPGTFKVVGTSDHYEFWCKECSYKREYGISKSKVRASEWGCGWQIELSEQLEKHCFWHQDNPGKSFEDYQKQKLDEASRQAMQELNKMFSRYFR